MTDTHLQDEQYSGRFNLSTWMQLLSFTRPYIPHVIVVALAAMAMSGVECLFTYLPRRMIDTAAELGTKAPLGKYVAIYAAGAIVMVTIVFMFIRSAGRISTNVSHDIREKCFNHLQDLSFSFYDKRQAGWLVSRLTGDCDRLSRTLAWGILLDIVWTSCMVISLTIMLLFWNIKLGLIIMATLPVLFCVALFFQKRIIRTSREVRRLNSNITAAFSECITGLMTTRTLVREQQNLDEFEHKIDAMYAASIYNAILSSALWPVVMAISGTGAAIALWRGGHNVMFAVGDSQISIGTLVQIINASLMLMFPIMEMARVFADMQNAQAAGERVFGLLNTAPDIYDSPEVAEAINRYSDSESNAADEKSATALDGMADKLESVEFRNVSFAYEADKKVLKNFSLKIAPGSTIALVGPTGGGKTTIASLMCRFYEPTDGEILLDGVEYRQRSLKWLQSNLGIVLQQPHLFSGTVRENIRYGRLDATDQEVEHAAKLVMAHDFITQLEDGYESEVGEGGSRLSTGQKQLISFARAVLADPRIFVMDEATSSVDTETEAMIQKGLSAILSGRISIVIAHRLSTIRSADMILYIEAGQAVEQGTHEQLLAKRGKYWQLYTSHFTEEKTEQVLAAEKEDDSYQE